MEGLIRQRAKDSCGVAAVAMFAGVTYEEAYEAGTRSGAYRPGKGTYSGSQMLRELGFAQENLGGSYERPEGARLFRSYSYFFENYIHPKFIRQMVWGRPALLSVPSLNKKDGWHFVYYDGEKVLDPQNGRKGKKFYTSLDELDPRELIFWSHVQ